MENQILALIASFIAMSFAVCSYFVKKKEMFLLFQSLCIIFLITSYFFTVQFFAMVGLFIGLVRVMIYYIYEKRGKLAPLYISFLLVLATLISYYVVNYKILNDSDPFDILCLLALTAYAFVFRIRDLKLVRFLALIPTTLSLLFTLLTDAALFATLSYAFELCANGVSIIKYHVIGDRKLKNNIEKAN